MHCAYTFLDALCIRFMLGHYQQAKTVPKNRKVCWYKKHLEAIINMQSFVAVNLRRSFSAVLCFFITFVPLHSIIFLNFLHRHNASLTEYVKKELPTISALLILCQIYSCGPFPPLCLSPWCTSNVDGSHWTSVIGALWLLSMADTAQQRTTGVLFSLLSSRSWLEVRHKRYSTYSEL